MKHKLLIIGDSYSTYKGMIPEGYAHYYAPEIVLPHAPVTKMELDDTWWIKFIRTTGVELVLNNSWSGSTVSYTGREGDCSRTSSYVFRYRQLLEKGFFKENDIDTVIVFGGTNDSWSNAPLGNEMSEGWERKDLYNVLPAVGYFFTKLRETLPDAKIYGICNCDIKNEVRDAIRNSCERVGGKAIVLEKIDKMNGHPTPLGMIQIKDQVLASVK